jgi:predicted N-acyltransferase
LPTTFRIVSSLADVDEAAWDALAQDDAQATPFTRWAFLEALEHAGCAGPRHGWSPRHLTLWQGGRLVAAAPAYLKTDSDGDFSRDWHWAGFVERTRARYYPKLAITVPFTPCGGRRFLVAADQDREACTRALLDGAHELVRAEGASSLQVLFTVPDEQALLERLGCLARQSIQFHWHNRGYADYDAWLATLDSKRRHQARRERGAAAGQGISLRTVRGPELAADPGRWGALAHDLHKSTVDKLMWGRYWLNRRFYDRLFARMPGSVEVVVAEREGQVVAGAFNVASATRLYGRYWGCLEDHPFLHFHVCLYHSIDDCIRRGLQVFEGGAGGEHKMSRGFDPTETWSSHAFADARLHMAFGHHLAEERRVREAELAAHRAREDERRAARALVKT